ncbi:PxKF domain-containing protein [Microbacterium sp. 2FI]|uniref:PxKF domain-containing protein n=1 Tax=Microbacterium sp. 2FI TaxID=2502193 RepID=UPI0010F95ED0|nr:PxKF domain-containing protein [Microbacterium sp. 2FI]
MASLTAMLAVTALAAAPAFADEPPPPDWTTIPGSTATVGGLTVSWQSASSVFAPWEGVEMLDEMLVVKPEVINSTAATVYVGYGTDFTTQGSIDPLWLPSGWGAFSDVADGITDLFWDELAPGESLETAGGWSNGMPTWSGHTITLFNLSEQPIDGATPTASPILSFTTPGRFVPFDLSSGDLGQVSQTVGERLTVVSGEGGPDLFSGLAGTVTASGLPAGEQLELWIAPNLNYAYFQILGGALPVSAQKVGTKTVAGDGTLTANFALPLGLETDVSYQMVAGVRGERYWPAGTWDDFVIREAPNLTEAVTPELPVGSGPQQVDLTDDAPGAVPVLVDLPEGTTAGTTSAVSSATGPIPAGFRITTDPPVYVHINSTATLGGEAEVCLGYDPLGETPSLFHYESATDTWDDITERYFVDVDAEPDRAYVCGLTSTFSPFIAAIPTFDFDGFFSPVSMDAANIAKPGQAIPVKFSLGGDQGLDVVESARFVIEGTDSTPEGELIPTTTAGGSGLNYHAGSDTYTYVWKTSKSWSLKTGQFLLEMSDGTTHEFDVTFKK